VAGDAHVVEAQQLGAALGHACAHRGRHEERLLARPRVHRKVIGAVDAGELHAGEGDVARSLRVGLQLLLQQR
jgi:hypothetical protein